MVADLKFGPSIKVNGIRPRCVSSEDAMLALFYRDEFFSWEDPDSAPWPLIKEIRLEYNHGIYTALSRLSR